MFGLSNNKDQTLICLTHCSDDLISEFSPNKSTLQREIIFYWYHDRYYGWNEGEYFHLMVINPRKALLRSRDGNKGFDGIHQDYLRHYEWGPDEIEPSIVVSPSKIKPTLIAKIDHTSKDKTAEVVYPHKYKGIKFQLLDKAGKAKKFDEIEELVQVVKQIKSAVPIIQPKQASGEYELEGFREFVTEKNGTFL